MTTLNQIIIEYQDLVDGKDLRELIELAFGPNGHGILFVNNIPGYSQQRKKTLPLFQQLANLPKETLQKYQRPDIFYSQGWSCGVQKFQGSYYVNCASDNSYPITEQNQKYFTEVEKKMFTPNKWVDDIPAIQVNVKALSRIMIEVGILLAAQIDAYASSKIETYPKNHLHDIIKNGHCHIGRLLHYFPYQVKGQIQDDWCGWHNDHGSLTALTSALYTDQKGDQITFPLKTGGLYAKNRFAQMARISIPKDMLAFQLGESTQIHSGGYLQATPHCVIRSEEIAGKKISRNTFALFMEPDPLQIMEVPANQNPQKVSENSAYKIPAIKDRWKNGIQFKEFHSNTIKYYS